MNAKDINIIYNTLKKCTCIHSRDLPAAKEPPTRHPKTETRNPKPLTPINPKP